MAYDTHYQRWRYKVLVERVLDAIFRPHVSRRLERLAVARSSKVRWKKYDERGGVIMADIDWTVVAAGALALATFLLVVVTYRLGTITKGLADANRRVADIDGKRLHHSILTRRIDRLNKRIDLAESMLRMKPETWVGNFQSGTFPEAEAKVIRQLARLIDPGPGKLQDQLDSVLGWIDKIDLGNPLEQKVIAENFANRFQEIQVLIRDDLPRWRALVKDLIAQEDPADHGSSSST